MRFSEWCVNGDMSDFSNGCAVVTLRLVFVVRKWRAYCSVHSLPYSKYQPSAKLKNYATVRPVRDSIILLQCSLFVIKYQVALFIVRRD